MLDQQSGNQLQQDFAKSGYNTIYFYLLKQI